MQVTGISYNKKFIEIIELPIHPWFIFFQFHPEFTSTPRDGHPLFSGFVQAAFIYKKMLSKRKVKEK